jgi:DNA-binding NtrC family response regulator
VASALASDTALPARRPPNTPPGFRSLADEVRDLERKRIGEALDATGGNQKRAAELIGMPLRTMVTKLTHYGLRQARGGG